MADTRPLEDRFLDFYDSCTPDEQEVLALLCLAMQKLGESAGDDVEGFVLSFGIVGPDQRPLGAQDKLGNFEIQDLMSRFNQAQTLASSVQKKQDDAGGSIISKIG